MSCRSLQAWKRRKLRLSLFASISGTRTGRLKFRIRVQDVDFGSGNVKRATAIDQRFSNSCALYLLTLLLVGLCLLPVGIAAFLLSKWLNDEDNKRLPVAMGWPALAVLGLGAALVCTRLWTRLAKAERAPGPAT